MPLNTKNKLVQTGLTVGVVLSLFLSGFSAARTFGSTEERICHNSAEITELKQDVKEDIKEIKEDQKKTREILMDILESLARVKQSLGIKE